MVCKKCGSNQVQVQMVSNTRTKKKGIIYWLCFGWLIEFFLWIALFLPMLILKLFGKSKVETKVEAYCVCQDCGNKWRR